MSDAKKYPVSTFKGIQMMTREERASVNLIPGIDRAPGSYLPPDHSQWLLFHQTPEVRQAKLDHLAKWLKAMAGDIDYPPPFKPGDK